MVEFNNIVSAAINVHDLVAQEIKAHVVRGGKVVDLGCGEGKVLCQLREYDCMGLDAVNNFRLQLLFVVADLNKDIAIPDGTLDGVVSSEVIEHLENPWHFIREIARMLKPGGVAVITTPNINNLISRIGFLRKGTFRMFEDEHYVEWGHITPLSNYYLRKMFNKFGLKVVNWQYNTDNIGNWKQKVILKFVSSFFGWMIKGDLGGDINIITIKK